MLRSLKTAQLKLHGIRSQEDAVQLGEQGRDGRNKFNEVRTGKNGPNP